jgi:hypothetical protein
MGPCLSRNKEVPKTICEMKHLPRNLLECILLKLSYAEIAIVRQVCRWFRDVGDGILDRKFRCLKTRAERHLASLVEEEDAPLGVPVQGGTSSTGGAESDLALPRPPPQGCQIDSRELMNVICSQIHLLSAVCYRQLFFSEVPQNFRDYSVEFKVKIIDVTHRILRLIRTSGSCGRM